MGTGRRLAGQYKQVICTDNVCRGFAACYLKYCWNARVTLEGDDLCRFMAKQHLTVCCRLPHTQRYPTREFSYCLHTRVLLFVHLNELSHCLHT